MVKQPYQRGGLGVVLLVVAVSPGGQCEALPGECITSNASPALLLHSDRAKGYPSTGKVTDKVTILPSITDQKKAPTAFALSA